MSTEQHRLATFMFTDMVGYSALAQRDDALAADLLAEHRRVLRSIFAAHNGRELDAVGDGFLVEFAPSAAQPTPRLLDKAGAGTRRVRLVE